MPSSLNAIARRRLANQHLVSSRLLAPTDVVRALGAVQAQDYGSAKWAIAQRTKRLTDESVEEAFARGEILRTHVLRPTWHFILPEDARWMLELTAPRIGAAMAYHNRQLELDPPTFRKGHKALERALRGGHHLTRPELSAVLGRARIDHAAGQRLGQLLMQAELDRVIISGPRRGNQFTYALFDERVPAAPVRDRDEALHDLARRYFTTRGPATVHDFSWWSGLSVRDAHRAIESADLARETHDGRTLWSARAPRAPRSTRIAHLLPNFDEYFVGFKDRSAFAARLAAGRAQARFNALMGHVLFVNGQIVGRWSRTLGKSAEIQVRPLLKLTSAERALVRRAVQRFGQFLSIPVQIRG